MNKVIDYICHNFPIDRGHLHRRSRIGDDKLEFTQIYLKNEFLLEVFTLATRNMGIDTQAHIHRSVDESPVYKLYLLGL